jgi:hypothetical protein
VVRCGQVNDLTYIVRAHQLCQSGYQVLWDKFATVWSAPNYCYRMGNLASILEIAEDGVCVWWWQRREREERRHSPTHVLFLCTRTEQVL